MVSVCKNLAPIGVLVDINIRASEDQTLEIIQYWFEHLDPDNIVLFKNMFSLRRAWMVSLQFSISETKRVTRYVVGLISIVCPHYHAIIVSPT